MYGEADFLRNFRDGRPPFLLSSAFPYCEAGGQKIFFFPKPHVSAWINQENSLIKKLKEVSFLSKAAFETWLVAGVEGVLKSLKNGSLKLKDELMISAGEAELFKTEKPKLYKDFTTPRNRLNRLKMWSDLFYAGAALYYPNSGMFFLLDIRDDEEYFDMMIHCLNLLRDEGIGGERTIGYGKFDYALEKLDILEADDAGAFLTLCLYHPTLEEVEKFLTKPKNYWSYRLITRGGFAQSPLLKGGYFKRSVRMMLEGSVFPRIDDRSVYGDFPEVLKEEETHAHAVYRYGYAFPLSIRV